MVTKARAFGIGSAGLLLSCAALAADDSANWSYEGNGGPQHWGGLSATYEACKSGLMQSPVELDQANAVGDLEVSVDYDASPLTVLNAGKTIQANFARGSYMTSGGKVFNLIQVHFHTPSEHTFSGKTYPLAAHFVHATDGGELGVLGIVYEEGESDSELQKIIDAAPPTKSDTRTIDGMELDPAAMLPDELEVFRYMGSLTTPPCSEGVNWHVAEDTVEASADQIRAMTALMGMNARPVLPLNGRLLVEPE